MKLTLITLVILFLTARTYAQNIEYTTDEECGCESVVVDGIETTQSGGLYGFRLLDGTVITPNKYKYVDRFNNGYCKVNIDDTHFGLIDRTGREVLPCIYDGINYPAGGRILAIKDNLIGYYDTTGALIIPHTYLRATDFSEGYAAVVVYYDSTYQCTYIDSMGIRPFNNMYTFALPFKDGYAEVQQDSLWGIIDKNGNYIMEPTYTMMSANGHGVFMAGSVDGLALFDYTMHRLTDYIYHSPGQFSDGRIGVELNGKFGFLDTKGNEVVPCIYDETGIFKQGRTQVRIGNKYGIVDTLGRVILPIEYENTYRKGYKYMFYEGLAMVERDGLTGYVDLDGNLVIPIIYERAYQFSQGLAAVKHNGLWGYIDTLGNIYMPFIFDVATPYHWGRAEVMYNGHVSKVDLSGRCVKNCNGIIAWREIFE